MNKMIELFRNGMTAYVKMISYNQNIRMSANHSAFKSQN